MRTVGFFAAASLSLVSVLSLVAGAPSAHADTAKAWGAAKAGLPAEAKIVVGVDLAAIQKTQLFTTFYPKLLAKQEATQLVDAMKSACKLDPLTAVQGMVVAVAADGEDGAAYIAFNGIDKAKLSSCLLAIHDVKAKTDPTAKAEKVSIKQDGNITELTKGADTKYIGWAAKDILVVPFKSEDKTAITRWLGGKGGFAKTELGKSLAKVNTAAAIWGAGEQVKELQPGITIKGGYGSVKVAAGNLDADVHAVMKSAADATALATQAKSQIDQAKSSGAVGALLNAVTVTTANDEVLIKALVAEKDLISMLALAGVGK